METDPEELKSEDFGADLEVRELMLELEPLDLGLLEYEPEDLFSGFHRISRSSKSNSERRVLGLGNTCLGDY